jgi:hypothetical protein
LAERIWIVADGILIPAVSQIVPLMVNRDGVCAKRKVEHNNSIPRKQIVFLISKMVGCGDIVKYNFFEVLNKASI